MVLKAFLAVSCIASLGCSFFPESSFDLAPESRLPRWFTLPRGLSRSDVSVTMHYYIKSNGHTATFTLMDVKNGRKITEVQGAVRDSQPLVLEDPPPGSPLPYPHYAVITVKGITDIVEHRQMKPIFYVTDDPAVWSKLGVSRPKF